MTMRSIFILGFASSIAISVGAQETIVINTSQGYLEGSVETSRNGTEFYSFKGIPFGQVVQRFEPAEPAPIPGWTGVRNATEFGPVCAQPELGVVIGEEDCLFLNVYTPRLSANSSKLPVMVYIHGGAFYVGSGDFSGNYFMDEDIVMVSMNYRLGALGFLSTGDEVIQGNMALKDQVLALKWVQDNIHFFGGDKDSVTISGMSAGGVSISHHILSPLSSGLFHRAIPIAGTSLNPYSIDENPWVIAKEFGLAQNCSFGDNSTLLRQCLEQRDFRDIAALAISRWYHELSSLLEPVVEKLRPGQSYFDVFLGAEPRDILEFGIINRVPTMFVVCSGEGLWWSSRIALNPVALNDLDQNWTNIAPTAFSYREFASPETLSNISQEIREFYFGDNPLERETVLGNLTKVYSDRFFYENNKKNALLVARWSPVYTMMFGYTGTYYPYPENHGASHGDDAFYMFPTPLFTMEPGSEDEIASKLLVKTFAHFVKNGTEMTTNPPWPQLRPDDEKLIFYYLDTNVSVIEESDDFKERIDFWKQIDGKLEELRGK